MSYPTFNPYIYYSPGSHVLYQASSYQSTSLVPNINRIPPSSPTYWTLVPSPSGGVLSVTGGTGIDTGGTAVNPVINNTGVIGISGASGGGVKVTGTSLNPILSGTYYGGSGISIAPDVSGNLPISAFLIEGNGINLTDNINDSITIATDLSGGVGISVSNASTPVITNTGVTSVTAGTAISVSAGTGGVTIGNTGVTALTAGTGIGISGSTGNVTISATGTAGVASVTSAGTGSGITIGGTGTNPTVSTNLTAGAGIAIANGSGSNLTIAQDISSATLTSYSFPYTFTNGGTTGGTLTTGYMTYNNGSSDFTNFNLPAGVWLVQMAGYCDCNNLTGSCAGMFSLQLSSDTTSINTLTIPGAAGFVSPYGTNTFVLYNPSGGTNYRIAFVAMGPFYSNGSANVTALKLVSLAGSVV